MLQIMKVNTRHLSRQQLDEKEKWKKEQLRKQERRKKFAEKRRVSKTFRKQSDRHLIQSFELIYYILLVIYLWLLIIDIKL